MFLGNICRFIMEVCSSMTVNVAPWKCFIKGSQHVATSQMGRRQANGCGFWIRYPLMMWPTVDPPRDSFPLADGANPNLKQLDPLTYSSDEPESYYYDHPIMDNIWQPQSNLPL